MMGFTCCSFCKSTGSMCDGCWQRYNAVFGEKTPAYFTYKTTTTSGTPPANTPEPETDDTTGWKCPVCGWGVAPWVEFCQHERAGDTNE